MPQELRPGEPVEHVLAHEAQQQGVASRAGSGVALDDGEHLAEEAVVVGGVHQIGAAVPPVLPLVEVVAHGIGEHGDGGRREVGLEDEDVVLEPAPALREAQPVRREEGSAEELVGSEGADDRRIPERDAVPGPGEELMRRAAPVARHPADDHVRSVPAREVVEPLQRLRAERVVVVGEEHVLAASGRDPDVARLARPARVRLVDHPDVRMRGGEGVQAGRRRVGGSVVDEDRLVLRFGERLAEDGVDAPVKVWTRVVDRDDHAHLHGHRRVTQERRRSRAGRGDRDPVRFSRLVDTVRHGADRAVNATRVLFPPPNSTPASPHDSAACGSRRAKGRVTRPPVGRPESVPDECVGCVLT